MTEADILTILRRHKVLTHYLGSSAAKMVRYAVWSSGKLVTEPMGHADANAARERMIAAEIREYLQKEGKG